MAGQARCRKVREVAHGRERLVYGRAAKSQRVARLAREDSVPEGLLVAGHQLVGVGAELLGDLGSCPAPARLRITSAAYSRPPTHFCIDTSRATETMRSASGIASPFRPFGSALAVPALGELAERAVDRRWKPDALSEHLGDLAHRGHVCGMSVHCPGQRAGYWSARASRSASGSGIDRTMPRMTSPGLP